MNENEILKILQQNARTSDEDIAKMLGMEARDVTQAIRKLERDGTIAGYQVVINHANLDKEQCSALIEVNSVPEREHGYDRVARMIAQYPEVQSLYLISGHSEFLVRVVGSSLKEISDFVGAKLAPMDGVKGTSTIFILKNYKKDGIILDREDDERQERQIAL